MSDILRRITLPELLPAVAALPVSLLSESARCRSCGYDIHAQTFADACPECGFPIRNTYLGVLAAVADPHAISRVKKGLLGAQVSIVLHIIGTPLASVWPPLALIPIASAALRLMAVRYLTPSRSANPFSATFASATLRTLVTLDLVFQLVGRLWLGIFESHGGLLRPATAFVPFIGIVCIAVAANAWCQWFTPVAKLRFFRVFPLLLAGSALAALCVIILLRSNWAAAGKPSHFELMSALLPFGGVALGLLLSMYVFARLFRDIAAAIDDARQLSLILQNRYG